ncbi:putative odorant-binding protein A10 [Aricia agestis]|uniref:putative odorant-binding protein A10 n=1 Tax=Aricia agestis TaxID=91739 RepID=UPI001C205F5E|nr:putative odorant-binding protein A10 [Aricia agestis]
MKLFLTILLWCFVIVKAYDDVNDDQYEVLLNSNEELKTFVKCLVDQGPCKDDFSKHIKGHMAQFYADGCMECDTRQKHYARLIYLILKTDFPELYQALEAKYDPQGNGIKRIDEKLSKYR